MKKKIQIGLCSLMFAVTSFASAAEKWGGVELGQAATAAAEEFKSEHGEALNASVSSIAIKKNIQGTAGTATITYKEAGATKTAELFCHAHAPGEIDCHGH